MSLRANQTNTPQFKAIDFFCGGGGMTCGLRQVLDGAFRKVVIVFAQEL